MCCYASYVENANWQPTGILPVRNEWLGRGGHKGLLAQQNMLNNAQDHLIASQLWTNGMVKWLSLSGFSLVAEVSYCPCALCLRVASKVANARLENSSTRASRGHQLHCFQIWSYRLLLYLTDPYGIPPSWNCSHPHSIRIIKNPYPTLSWFIYNLQFIPFHQGLWTSNCWMSFICAEPKMLRIWWIGTLPIWHIFDEIWWWFDDLMFGVLSDVHSLEVCWWVSWIWSVFLSSQAILRCEFCDAASFKSISQSSGVSLMILMVERKWQDLLLAMRTGAMAQSLVSEGNQRDKRFGIWSCLVFQSQFCQSFELP